MREASRRLSQSLFDAYETDWAGEEDLGGIVEVSMVFSYSVIPRAAIALPLQIFVLQEQQDSHIARRPKPVLFPSLYTYLMQCLCCAF